MATTTIIRNKTLPDSSSKTDFHDLIDTATATTTDITNSDIVAGAAIADSKLAQITTAGKVSGAALTSLTSIPSGAAKITLDDSSNSSVSDVFYVEHTTTGSPATGIGTGISIKVEDTGGSEEQASVDIVMTDVTDAQEDADIVFSQNINGTITESVRLDADGGLTVKIGSPTTPIANTIVKDNIVKGWINFNGTGTIAINDSFNVTSITDNGTGDYIITWNTDFANANYCVVGMTGGAAGTVVRIDNAVPLAVGATRINNLNAAMNLSDTTPICVLAIGDQ